MARQFATGKNCSVSFTPEMDHLEQCSKVLQNDLISRIVLLSDFTAHLVGVRVKDGSESSKLAGGLAEAP